MHLQLKLISEMCQKVVSLDLRTAFNMVHFLNNWSINDNIVLILN